MLRFFLLAGFSLFINTVFAQHQPYPVYLIGNTATKPISAETYTLLKQELDSQKLPFSVIHLGDITLNEGWPEDPTPDQMVRIDQLLALVKDNPQGKIIFLPGDKDWNNSGRDGLKAVKRLEKYVNKRLPFKNGFTPGSGCPGPEILDVNPFLRIVTINSPWWMHPFDKPEVTDTDCNILTKTEFLEELQEAISGAENRNVLIAGHHPILSTGAYGGRITLKKHLFPLTDKTPTNWTPLPGFGSIYAAYRQNIGTPRDFSNVHYAAFRQQLSNVFKQVPGLIYASAHEYNLQLLQSDDTYHLISGSLTEKETLGNSPETIFNAAKTGFAKLEYFPNGEVSVRFYQIAGTRLTELYSKTLFQSPCLDLPEPAAPVNRLFVPCPAPDSIPTTELNAKDGPVTRVAGAQYKANAFKRIFFGSLYRSTWTTPVQVPVLDLRKTYGGLKPTSRGGGRQTKSLQFRARNGREYVFRSVDKDPVKALPLVLRETFVTDVLREITPTAHPYSPLIVSALLDSTDILHARPRLFVLPNDPALGPFRPEFAGMLGTLEDRPVDPTKNKKGFAGAQDITRTYGLFRKLYDDHDNRIDAYAFGKARAFDIWIGDFGRHDDNWRWAGFKNETGERIYKPIPRDRDHSFSRWNGLLPWLADRPFVVGSIQNFGYKYKGLKSLTYPARHLDRALLQSLSRQDWQKIAKELQADIDEATIDKAITAAPKETIPISGNEIAFKLKNRLKTLPEVIDDYYLALAQVVDVVGSNKNEYFRITRNADGSVRVQEYEKDKASLGPEETAYFDRTFFPKETREIRIFGLDGKDVFELSGHTAKSIQVRIIGGEGGDLIRDDSFVEGRRHFTRVYDVPKTEMQLGPESKDLTSRAVDINSYNRQEFRYNYDSPMPGIIYNRSDGLGASLTVKFGRYTFREEEEKRIFSFSIRGTDQGAFQVSTGAIWNNVWQTWSLGGDISVGSYFPFYNFFGLGNNTIKTETLYDDKFYQARYKGVTFAGFTQTRFLRKSRFRIGPLIEQLSSTPQEGTILNTEVFDQLITGRESLVGGFTELDFDLRDNENFTLRGFRFNVKHATYQRLTRQQNTFGLTTGYLQYFGTARLFMPITLVAKLGGAKNYGKDLPFYKYTSLGLNDNLRGYVNNRFFGDESSYLNTELRFHLGRVRTSILPFYYGIVTFYDQGKVWYKGSDDGGWHRGYGAGFYFAPLEQRYALNVLFGHSAEEKLLIQFSLGLVLDK